jgi:hypothetical protein
MRRRVTKALFTAAAAGATITSLGFAAAVPASAAQGPGVLNLSSGGWAAGNVLAPTLASTGSTWRFRYASATTILRDVTPTDAPDLNNNALQQAFSVQLSNQKATYAAQMVASAAGVWKVQFVQYYQNGTSAQNFTTTVTALAACNPTASPWTAGTQVRLDVFYDQNAGTITFTAYSGSSVVCDDTEPAWNLATQGGGPFTEAYTGGVFTPLSASAPAAPQGDPYLSVALTGTPPPKLWVRPTVDRSLYPVSAVRITSYNGTMGSVQGPWPFTELALASSAANDFADPGLLWDGGANFGVWLRA